MIPPSFALTGWLAAIPCNKGSLPAKATLEFGDAVPPLIPVLKFTLGMLGNSLTF